MLGDTNHDLINAYLVAREEPVELYRAVTALPVSKSHYYAMRATESPTPFEAAVRFLFLNRLCYNGVFRTNRSGQFNVPFGSRTGSFPSLDQFCESANALRRCELMCGDFARVCDLAVAGDFVYLDPPYTSSGKKNRGEYGCGAFNYHDEQRLLDTLAHLTERGCFVALSYTADSEICRRLDESRWDVRRLEVPRHVGGFVERRRDAAEILALNYAAS